MAGKLKPLDVERENKPGKYADGDGLYLALRAMFRPLCRQVGDNIDDADEQDADEENRDELRPIGMNDIRLKKRGINLIVRMGSHAFGNYQPILRFPS